MNSSDKLWELKRLEYKRAQVAALSDLSRRGFQMGTLRGMSETQDANKKYDEISAQISKLLEDE